MPKSKVTPHPSDDTREIVTVFRGDVEEVMTQALVLAGANPDSDDEEERKSAFVAAHILIMASRVLAMSYGMTPEKYLEFVAAINGNVVEEDLYDDDEDEDTPQAVH